MKLQEHKPKGVFEREATTTEIESMAKQGNKEAMREQINAKGGWAKLTPKDKDDILKNLTGYGEE